MKEFWKRIIFNILANCFVSLGAPDNRGTEFLVAFMENRQGTLEELEFFVTTSSTATVSVRVYCPTWGNLDTNFTVTSGYVHLVVVDKDYKVFGSTVQQKGILITADDEITIYGMNRQKYTADGFTGIPTDVLGTNYYVVTHYPSYSKVQLMVVGVYNSTSVSIQLPSGPNTENVTFNGTSYYPGDIITMLLNRFDALQVQGDSDLTGAHITSDKAISVFSGNLVTTVGSGGSRDHLVDQIPPVNTWGKAFATVPIPNRTTGDYFRFVASESNTLINYTCNSNGTYNESSVFLLKNGDFTEKLISSDSYCYVQSDRPVLLAQIVLSKQSSSEPTDPAMIVIPPIELYAADYTFATPRYSLGSYENFLMFVIKANEIDGLMIDSNQLPSSTSFHIIPYTEYVGGFVNITEGSHTVRHVSPVSVFGVFLYGSANLESYGYPAGMRLTGINEPCVKTITLFGDGLDNDCDGLIDEELCTEGNKGKDTDGDGLTDEDCAQPAPIDGSWAEWSSWGDCVEVCPLDGSTVFWRRFRKRTCTNPRPQYNGNQCAGNSTDSNECTIVSEINVVSDLRKSGNRWRTLPALVNLNFALSMAWVKKVSNVGVCSLKCDEDENCLSFSYNSENNMCQSYNKMYLNPLEVPSQVQDSTKYFITNDDYQIEQTTAFLYKFYPSCMGYIDAEMVCQADKSELLIINTTEKLQSIWSILELSSSYIADTSPYVSGTLKDNSTWTFWNNVTIPSDIWSSDHSTFNLAVDKCAVVTKYGLISSNCEVLRHFICER